MKKIVTIILLLIAIMASNCKKITTFDDFNNIGNQPIDTGTVTITFDKYKHDFGYVSLGTWDTCYFSFKNEGTADLKLASLCSSCNNPSVALHFDELVIPPRTKGNLRVIWNFPPEIGIQEHIITVSCNAITPLVLLTITADVI